VLLLSGVMAAGVALAHWILEQWAGGGGLAGEIARLGLTIALGIGTIAAGGRALDLPDVRELFARRRGR
jgi:hypothetical protein